MKSLGTVLSEIIATVLLSALPTVSHMWRWADISHLVRLFFASGVHPIVDTVFALVVFDLFFSKLSQEIGWKERLRNDLFCVGLDANQSVNLNWTGREWRT